MELFTALLCYLSPSNSLASETRCAYLTIPKSHGKTFLRRITARHLSKQGCWLPGYLTPLLIRGQRQGDYTIALLDCFVIEEPPMAQKGSDFPPPTVWQTA